MRKPKRNENLGCREWEGDRWMLHRRDGPALEYDDGRKAWWIHGACKATQSSQRPSWEDDLINRFYEDRRRERDGT